MTSAEREVALKHLAASRDSLLSVWNGLSSEQRAYRTAPDRWSVAELVEHITTVERLVLGNIEKSIEQPPDPSKRSTQEGREEVLLDDVAGRVTRFPAPEFLHPTGKLKDEELLMEFEDARRRTRDFTASTDKDLRRHFFPHPVFGEMDCYQWLRLIAAHCDRHRSQGEEVIASPGFPRAGRATSG